jgi:hypothetical protein
MELVVTIGRRHFQHASLTDSLSEFVATQANLPKAFQWGSDLLMPMMDREGNGEPRMLGLLGLSQMPGYVVDEEQSAALEILSERALLALRDWHLQEQLVQTMKTLSPQVEYIQRLRAAASYDQNSVLQEEPPTLNDDLTQWVRDALTHYWGGPKLTESPLLNLSIVQDEVKNHDGNAANGIRAILRTAIERTRPEGERRFTGEWTLYNILDLKFLEGKKVREIASRLAMSEADLYRKQRIAIEAVTKTILEMEEEAHQENHAH